MGSNSIAGRLAEEWIQLAQDRDRGRAVVNTVMNVRVLAPRSYVLFPSSRLHVHSKLYCSPCKLRSSDFGHSPLITLPFICSLCYLFSNICNYVLSVYETCFTSSFPTNHSLLSVTCAHSAVSFCCVSNINEGGHGPFFHVFNLDMRVQ
jgi:hypothetical protein